MAMKEGESGTIGNYPERNYVVRALRAILRLASIAALAGGLILAVTVVRLCKKCR